MAEYFSILIEAERYPDREVQLLFEGILKSGGEDYLEAIVPMFEFGRTVYLASVEKAAHS